MSQDALFPAPTELDVREALLNVVRDAGEPLTASAVVKQAATSRRMKADEAVPILEQLVAEGILKRFPPKTARGKQPRYWDRDPRIVGREAILEVVQQALEPVSASDVGKRLKLPFKLKPQEIAEILRELAQEWQVHEIPPKTAKSGPRYWNHDAGKFARRCLLTLLEEKGPQAESSVKRTVKWLNGEDSRRVIEDLLASRSIRVHPPVGTSKGVVYGTRPPAPEPYLKKIGTQLRDVVDRLKGADVPVVELRRALVQVVESAGVPFGTPVDDRRDGRAPAADSRDLIAVMKRIEPGAERGALVTSRDLRRAAGLNKSEFDALALELARKESLVLHRHDFASSLSPEERDELITDGRGTYYVGLALRPERRGS